MKRFVVFASAFLLSVAAVGAADDPIAVRKALMQANAASAAVAGAMMKGDMAYNPAVAKAAIATSLAAAMALGDFFPEGSDEGDTRAAPAIWEDPEAFRQALVKFEADAASAAEASGREGPADLAAFQQAFAPVLSNCGSCHETFRTQ